ncbi:MAG: NAD(P)-binding protein, partial [Actinomycetota bacterium]|nr:NAD(P)-binding protein [Actinomycetota bacterium]
MSAKPRVAVLGGGVGALTAAFELSRGAWQERFESITVYQLGWRLGGKGASGRGVNGRIEEHGLHVWFGFYENAFRMMRECYRDLGRDPDLEDVFVKASCIVAEELRPYGWQHWIVNFPEDDAQPGRLGSSPRPPTVADYLKIAIRLAVELVASVVREAGRPPPVPGAHPVTLMAT